MTTETGIQKTGADQGAMVSAETNKILALMDASDRLGTWMAKAYQFKNLEQGKVAAMTCLTEGLKPSEFMATYHVLENGTLQMTANAMLAKFQMLGGMYDIMENDEEKCIVEFTWEGKKTTQQFTIEQADKKGLIKPKSAWANWPEDQLLWTVVRKYLRRYVPSHFAGSFHPDGTKEEAIIDYTAKPVEKAVVAEIIPKPKMKPAGPPPESAPKIVDVEAETGTDSAGDFVDAEQPLITRLKESGMPLQNAVNFLVNVPHWLDAQAIKHASVSDALAMLKDSQVADILGRFDEFYDKVRSYYATKEEPAPESEPEPAPEKPVLKPVKDSVTAPKNPKRGGKKKDEQNDPS